MHLHGINVAQNRQERYSVRMLGTLNLKHPTNAAEETILDINQAVVSEANRESESPDKKGTCPSMCWKKKNR